MSKPINEATLVTAYIVPAAGKTVKTVASSIHESHQDVHVIDWGNGLATAWSDSIKRPQLEELVIDNGAKLYEKPLVNPQAYKAPLQAVS